MAADVAGGLIGYFCSKLGGTLTWILSAGETPAATARPFRRRSEAFDRARRRGLRAGAAPSGPWSLPEIRPMKHRILRCGIEVSEICLGCWAIGGPFWDQGGWMGYGDVDD